MSIITRTRRFLYNLFLGRKLKPNVASMTMNMRIAKSIGILFNAENREDTDVVLRFTEKLKEKDKNISLLGYLRSDKKIEETRFPYFTAKDMNWYMKPGGEKVKGFLGGQYDMVINASIDECLPLEYISKVSDAKFRVGHYREADSHPYDLMISGSEAGSVQGYMDQVDHYLKMIKTR